MSNDKDMVKQRETRDPPATIRRIFDAARVEFGANGFDGTKVEHIARRAKVSKQIIYFYFKGKDDLYWELLKDIAITLNDRVLTIPFDDLSPEEAVRTYIEVIYDAFLEDPIIGMVSLDQSLHGGAQLRSINEIRKQQKAINERMSEVIRRGQAAGVFHEAINGAAIEFMAVTITTGCVSSSEMLKRYTGQTWSEKPAERRTFAIDFIMRGLRK